MSIKKFTFKIGKDGTIEEVTTNIQEDTNQPSAAEKILYFVVGIPVLIVFILHQCFR
ncbi:MAG: hypothetical protein U0350_40050 [Caldilineaceae bacterium]